MIPKDVQDEINSFISNVYNDTEQNHQLNIMEAVANYILNERVCEWEKREGTKSQFNTSCQNNKTETDISMGTEMYSWYKHNEMKHCFICGAKIKEVV